MTTRTKANKRVAEILRRPYSRVLVPEMDGRFSAEVLEFPGCFSQGDTASEAYANLEEAARNWVQAMIDQGSDIPPPASTNVSGRFALRLPRDLHAKATRLAERDGVSLNQFIVTALAERVGGQTAIGRLERQFGARLERLELTSWNAQATQSIFGDDYLVPAPQTPITVAITSTGVSNHPN